MLVPQATDADEEGTANSNVTYSISSTSPAGVGSHFHLDPLSGRLNVTSALDYDVLQFPQNSAGIVKLVVVAKDNGSTRLSASVTVAVTLNVSLYVRKQQQQQTSEQTNNISNSKPCRYISVSYTHLTLPTSGRV